MSHVAVPCMPIVTPTQRRLAQLVQALVEPWNQLCCLVASALARRQAQAVEAEGGGVQDALEGGMSSLDGLSPQMLRDVGFAAWQVESAEMRRSREIQRWLW